MQGIRAWNYEKKEFYIEGNFSYLLAVLKSIGDIELNQQDTYDADGLNMELSERLAVKSVQGTPKESDNYEILFRERLIYRFYNLECPKVLGAVISYSIDEEKLKALEEAANKQMFPVDL
ncbi:MAG: hypothetical protein Q8936_01305 [Bacillota bacterium]|nr:hypothetical protein [Bacillota bacterium]